jgi:hypothetical protein
MLLNLCGQLSLAYFVPLSFPTSIQYVLPTLNLNLQSYRAERKQRKWRRPRTPQELALLEQLLGKATTSSDESKENEDKSAPGAPRNRRFGSTVFQGDSNSGIQMTSMSPNLKDDQLKARENASQAVLARHLLKADDVELIDRIGAGAFGEVRHEAFRA